MLQAEAGRPWQRNCDEQKGQGTSAPLASTAASREHDDVEGSSHQHHERKHRRSKRHSLRGAVLGNTSKIFAPATTPDVTVLVASLIATQLRQIQLPAFQFSCLVTNGRDGLRD